MFKKKFIVTCIQENKLMANNISDTNFCLCIQEYKLSVAKILISRYLSDKNFQHRIKAEAIEIVLNIVYYNLYGRSIDEADALKNVG